MIFAHTWKLVLSGDKTVTRRLAHLNDEGFGPVDEWGHELALKTVGRHINDGGMRLKWQVGRTYAVQPGRGKKAVGRIRITGIRREQLQDISPEDVKAEGVRFNPDTGYEWLVNCENEWQFQYAVLWNNIHTKPGTRWEDSPDVWVLSFELVEATNDDDRR